MSASLAVRVGGRRRLDAVAALVVEPGPLVERVMELAREVLGLEMAYVADTRAGLQSYIAVSGDGESFGARTGESVPLAGSYCERMLVGALPNVIRDARRNPATSALPITDAGGIGSYVGVPIVFSDGQVFGTFCCLGHSAAESLSERDAQFMRVLAQLISDQVEREQILDENRRLGALAAGVEVLLAALEARDGYTEIHSGAVVALALDVGATLDLSGAQLADLEAAALLHDIGKLGVPDAILRKPGPLTEQEWQLMKEHPLIGERIVSRIETLSHLGANVRSDHERFDGTGYPDGLKGEQIPLLARIVFVCDAYHAMTSDRPYRRALSTREALDELRTNAGSQFCPTVVAAALEVLTTKQNPVAKARAEAA